MLELGYVTGIKEMWLKIAHDTIKDDVIIILKVRRNMREVLEGDEELKTNFYFPIPEPGIVVKGLDIVNLNGDPSVKMMEENENRRESFGASYTLSYIPDPSGGHKEFIMIDQNYRPISLHRQEKSAWDQEVWRFVYDEQGRLIEKNDELYIYESDQSDDSGHFTYKTEKLR